MQNLLPHPQRLFTLLLAVGALLMVPFVAMQFTAEVNWSLFDFVAMGVLLLIVALIGEGIWRRVQKKEHRWMLLVALALAFLLVWAELAVGIFGTPFAGN